LNRSTYIKEIWSNPDNMHPKEGQYLG